MNYRSRPQGVIFKAAHGGLVMCNSFELSESCMPETMQSSLKFVRTAMYKH